MLQVACRVAAEPQPRGDVARPVRGEPQQPPERQYGRDCGTGRGRLVPPIRVTATPDVVRDLLRPPQIEDRDEPAERGPIVGVPPFGPERVEIAIRAEKPAEEE